MNKPTLQRCLSVVVMVIVIVIGCYQLVQLYGRVSPSYSIAGLTLSLSQSNVSIVDSLNENVSLPWRRNIETVQRARRVTSDDSLILVFLQNAFAYYGNRQIIRDVDTRMIPFYESTNTADALYELNALGITHVYIPPITGWPTIAQSEILNLLNNQQYAELVFNHHNHKFYRMIPSK